MRFIGIILIVVGVAGLFKSIQNLADNPPADSLIGAYAPGALLVVVGTFWLLRKSSQLTKIRGS